MTGKLYLGEIKKILRPKVVLTLCIVFIIFFIIFAIVYNINWENTLMQAMEQLGDTQYSSYMEIFEESNIFKNLTAESVESYIEVFQNEYQISIKDGNGLDYYYKGVLTMLDYVKEHNLYGQTLNIAGYNVFIKSTAEDFALAYFSVVLGILIIYSVVAMAGLYLDEYKSGTIKLIMIRPLTRNRLTWAKILAMFTLLLGFLGITTLIGYLYGLAAFGSAGKSAVYIIFNARKVFVASYSFYVFIKLLFGSLSLLSFGMLSFCIGTLLRKKTSAILIGLVISLGIIANILSFLKIGRFLFSVNADLSNYFGLTYNLPHKANFFIAMPLFIVYNLIFYLSTFLVTNKRDII